MSAIKLLMEYYYEGHPPKDDPVGSVPVPVKYK